MQFISDQQKACVLSEAKYRLINGCAGSHKTDTLLKCALRDIEENGQSILFLTLVSSVTFEIKSRLENALDFKIYQRGRTNHYIGNYHGVNICVSNFDAWVHNMLGNELLKEFDIKGNEYTKKTKVLEDVIEQLELICVDILDIKTSLLVIDEVQDLNSSQMKVVLALCKVNPNLKVIVAGDKLQSIFEAGDDFVHSMNLFKTLKPDYFELNKCMRCPKAHIDFNNKQLALVREKHYIPPMISDDTNMEDKPFLFCQYQAAKNTSAFSNAFDIVNIIKVLFSHDNTLNPGDVVVLSTKTKNNFIFEQLKVQLKEAYEIIGFKDAVYHFSTDGIGYHQTIDWNKAQGKTALLSIHGDKGKGHKVVILSGITEGGLPTNDHLFKPSELKDQSLFNVATTRSTKYLFIGFSSNMPSRYLLNDKMKFSNNTYYSTWDKNQVLPEIYNDIKTMPWERQTHNVYSEMYISGQFNYAIRSLLAVKEISSTFESERDFLPSISVEEETFGKRGSILKNVHLDYYIILGYLGELMIHRLLYKKELVTFLKYKFKNNTILYTDDERLLSCWYDVAYLPYDKTKGSVFMVIIDKIYDKDNVILRNPKLELIVDTLIDCKQKGITIVHNVFEKPEFIEELKLFVGKTSNEELDSQTWWNVTLFYTQLKSKMYRPIINTFLGWFSEPLNQLHDNVKLYAETLKGKDLLFSIPLSITNVYKIHKIIKDKKGEDVAEIKLDVVGINGEYDIFNKTDNEIIEIKTSHLKEYSPHWIVQMLIYAMMMNTTYDPKVSIFTVVNILKGIKYKVYVDLLPFHDVVVDIIAPKYEWVIIQVRAMLEGIKNHKKNSA